MEFGPRALGNRSIVGDARSPRMQSVMNLKIKYRESFRPFAPSCLEERVSAYFELDRPSPYMLLVADVRAERHRNVGPAGDLRERIHQVRSDLPAITHVDYSARVQTVNEWTNKPYHDILKAFERRTGGGRDHQHIVQRARRTDRVYAGRRLSLLHADGDGRVGVGVVYSAQVRAARLEGCGQLERRIRIGLI